MADFDNSFVPIYNNIKKTDRIDRILDVCMRKIGVRPQFFVRVPGRVNLIGEHIDYCGYGVCPMAIEQDIMLAVAVTDEQFLKLHNTNQAYPSFECLLDDFSILVGDGAPSWYQYFLCGVKGIFDVLPQNHQIRGMQIVVDGTVPPSAGLSSSSALVSAAALATTHTHNLKLSKKKIADLCAECERYIGTQGGGMDQAIAFLATEGCAKFIEFNPLRSTDINLPSDAVFVIAHSLVELNKASTADYNCRVVECRLAAQLIAKRHGIDWRKIRKLGDLQENLKISLPDMIAVVETILHQHPYTKDEIIKELGTTLDDLEITSLTQNTKDMQNFKLHQRALHVFKEALRVQQFHKACMENSIETLGKLMYESHESLRDLYECSHPKLDRLVELSVNIAYGARLTGAGWGGCIVALLSPKNVDKFIRKLIDEFYTSYDGKKPIIFATTPKSGACIYNNQTNSI